MSNDDMTPDDVMPIEPKVTVAKQPPMIQEKKKKKSPDAMDPVVQRLPPHSDEAEQGVLGCILLEPSRLPEVQSRLPDKEAFFDIRNQTIYSTLLSMQNNGGIDQLTLLEKLSKRHAENLFGGFEYVNSLSDKTPSAANISAYAAIVAEKYSLRRLIKTCTETVGRAFEWSGEVSDLISEVDTDFAQVFADSRSDGGQDRWSISALSSYDTKHDPNAVIGMHDGQTTRYLCRGYGAWLIGPSGIGKSSLTHQHAYLWALGKPVFGMFPIRPLRVLIVQSENDIGDNAEAVQGILSAIPDITVSDIAAINQRVMVVRCRGKTGASFCQWLEHEIKAFQADICFVDPLLRFAGIDVGRQDQCTTFLNNHLDPVLAHTGVVLIGAHHTGKPKGEGRDQRNMTIYEKAYAGIGSSELVNWARAVTVMEPKPDNTFEMTLAKRGPRAWATHPNGDFTTTVFLRHDPDKIFWVQTDPPVIEQTESKGLKAGRKSKVDEIVGSNTHDFCSACKVYGQEVDGVKVKGDGLNDAAKRLEKSFSKQKLDYSTSTCKRAIPALVASGKLTKGDDGLYYKGPNS